MKKNFLKTITLILSCLLLIGAVIGISVSAETEATVEIKYKNLAYEAAPQLVYYVDAQNVAEGDTVKVLFYDAEPTEVTVAGASYTAESFGTLTVSGVDYAAFASDEIAPKNLRLAIWAVPAVVNANGEIVAHGAAVKYSVFDYALDRFNMSPTPDQLALYTSVLDFGGAVQEVLHAQDTYTEDDLAKAGGFANAYCGIRQDVLYDGKVAEIGETVYYKPGEIATLTAEKSYNLFGIFRGFLDEDGELVAEGAYPEKDIIAKTPGVTVYQSEYTTTGSYFNTYDSYLTDGSANDVNILYKGKSGETLKNSIGIHGLKSSTFGAAKTDESYARIDKDSSDETNQVFTIGATTKAGGNTYAWTLDEVAVDADKYIFQTDFKWNGASTSTSPIYARFDSSVVGDDKCNLWYFQLKDSGPTTSIYTLENLDGTAWKASLAKGEWYTLRFEIIPLSTTHYNLAIYIDGAQIHYEENRTPNTKSHTIAVNEVNKCIGFRIFNRSATNYNMEFDNTYMGVETDVKPVDSRGEGLYYNDENAVGTKYSYDDLENITTDNVLYIGSGTNISSDDDSFNFSSGDPNGGFGIKYGNETNSGTTYVFETDFYFGGGKATKPADQLAWFGLSASNTNKKTSHFLPLAFNYKTLDGIITNIVLRDYVYGSLATLNLGTWYNIRFVYTVNNTLNEDGTVATNGYGGNVDFYLNGELVKSYATKGYTASDAAAGSASNEKLTHLGFEFRSTYWCGVTEINWQFDNTYLGAFTPVEEGAGSGDTNTESGDTTTESGDTTTGTGETAQ